MNGATVASAKALATLPAGWVVVGSGDFDGDGSTDLLLRKNNALAIWFISTNGAVTSKNVGNLAAAWSVDLTGDFSSNGRTDLLFTNVNGARALWFMNGSTVVQSVNLGVIATTWVAQNSAAE
jgi:hypothetical protein